MTPEREYWFPGRWLGGTSLILGPLLLLIGATLRIRFHFFFPQQLAAFKEHPALMTVAYNCILAGNILLWPGIVTLARLIGAKRPGWAAWGGSFVLFGLFARTFHAGVDHMAFQLVRAQDLESARNAVASSYGAFHVVSGLTAMILFGWILLAIGSYLSGTLGLLRSTGLGMMAALMIGVLKGSSPVSVAAITGLCTALVPLGVEVLRAPPTPALRDYLVWSLTMVVLSVALFALGRLG